MINLLDEKDKLFIESEYRRRVFNLYGMSLAVILMVAAALIGVSYMDLMIEKGSLEEMIGAETSHTKELESLSLDIKTANSLIEILTADAGNILSPTALIDEVTSRGRGKVKITSIAFAQSESGSSILRLSGVSVGRKELILFTEELEKSPFFISVDSPFSNLIKDIGGEFTVNIVVAPYVSASSTQNGQ